MLVFKMRIIKKTFKIWFLLNLKNTVKEKSKQQFLKSRSKYCDYLLTACLYKIVHSTEQVTARLHYYNNFHIVCFHMIFSVFSANVFEDRNININIIKKGLVCKLFCDILLIWKHILNSCRV